MPSQKMVALSLAEEKPAMILESKVVVVTGGGHSSGREVSKLPAQEGGKVVVNDSGVALDRSSGTPAVAGAVVKERAATRDLSKHNITANAIWPSAVTRRTASVPEAAYTSGERCPATDSPSHVCGPHGAYLASDLA